MPERFHSFGTNAGIQPESMQIQRWRTMGLDDIKGRSVLDIGCAEGWFSMKCLDAGAVTVMGIDCERRLDPALKGRITQRMGAVDDPVRNPVPQNGAFDIILCLRVLYHMRDPILALERMRKALKPGGVMLLEMWFDDPGDGSETMRFLGDEPPGMRWSITGPCLKRMLRACGFSEPEELYSYMGGHRRIWKVIGR